AALRVFIAPKREEARSPRWDKRREAMHPFPDSAIARFVVCYSERVAPAVGSHHENAILRSGRCKRRWCHLRGRTYCGTLIVPARAGRVVCRVTLTFAQRVVALPAGVPLLPPRRASTPRQQRGRNLTTTTDGQPVSIATNSTCCAQRMA